MDVWTDDLPQDAALLPLLGDKARIAELEAENARTASALDAANVVTKFYRDELYKAWAENAKLRADFAALMAKAAQPPHLIESATEYYAWWGFPPRPISALPTTHAACRHCGAAFLAEVVSTHEATCELRPAEDEKVEL